MKFWGGVGALVEVEVEVEGALFCGGVEVGGVALSWVEVEWGARVEESLIAMADEVDG